MEVKCDRCGGSTSPKEITSKKTGKNYTIYECNGSCMAGKYKYGCFPPRESKPKASSANPNALDEINHTLRRIEAIILKAFPQAKIEGEASEAADTEAPF